MYGFELVGEDDAFAAYEAASLAEEVRHIAPGIAIAEDLSTYVDHLAWTRTIVHVVVQTTPDLETLESAVLGASMDRSGSAAVRARAIRGADGDTQAVERVLGAVLVDRGFEIDLEDPDHVLRVLLSTDVALVGWVAAEPGGDVGNRRPTDRPFFQPGSMAPRLARGLVNIAGVHQGVSVLDPMCGTGGIVLEAVLVGGDALGFDVQKHMVRGARENLEPHTGRAAVARGDAANLPIRDTSLDVVIFDAPYGRQSKVAGPTLLGNALSEARRVADRSVVVSDRPFDKTASAAGWTIERTFSRRVHRSLTRHIYHLE